MGTHSALVVKKGGEVLNVEATLDGYNLDYAFKRWIECLAKNKHEPFSWLNATSQIGSSLEFDEDREHDQEFFLGINYDTKTIYTTPEMWLDVQGNHGIKESIAIMTELQNQGWTLDLGYDTDDVK